MCLGLFALVFRNGCVLSETKFPNASPFDDECGGGTQRNGKGKLIYAKLVSVSPDTSGWLFLVIRILRLIKS